VSLCGGHRCDAVRTGAKGRRRTGHRLAARIRPCGWQTATGRRRKSGRAAWRAGSRRRPTSLVALETLVRQETWSAACPLTLSPGAPPWAKPAVRCSLPGPWPRPAGSRPSCARRPSGRSAARHNSRRAQLGELAVVTAD